MSDFFQHGLISTLHRLVDGPLISRHEPLPALGSVVLGSQFDDKTLESLVQTYKTVSTDFVRRYQHVANLNCLPFDLSRETGAAKAFSETLNVARLDFLQGRRSGSLPPWRRLLQTKGALELSIIGRRGVRRSPFVGAVFLASSKPNKPDGLPTASKKCIRRRPTVNRER
jgi:hypothetical protein